MFDLGMEEQSTGVGVGSFALPTNTARIECAIRGLANGRLPTVSQTVSCCPEQPADGSLGPGKPIGNEPFGPVFSTIPLGAKECFQ